jgi:uncharacterized protein (TIGR02147 family)
MEESTHERPARVLQRVLRERIARNPRYSLRAFAKSLGVSSAYMSYLLNGKRRLSFSRALEICVQLKLNEEETSSFLRGVAVSSDEPGLRRLVEGLSQNPSSPAFDEFFVLEADRFALLSQWYHLPLLDLTTCEGFSSDPTWIAQRLGLDRDTVENSIARLMRLGLLKRTGLKLEKTHEKLTVPTQSPQVAVQNFHLQMIDRARATVEKAEARTFSKRSISSTTFAANMSRLEEARAKIEKFQQELSEFLATDPCQEVYQLNVQFFPLTDHEA